MKMIEKFDGMKVLALDPGLKTGYCVLRYPINLVERGELELLTEESPTTQRTFLRDLIDEAELVVCEDFRIYAHKAKGLVGDSLPASQVIGMVKYICTNGVVGTRRLHMTSAVTRTYLPQFIERAVMPKDVTDHERDAIQHALMMSIHQLDGMNHPTVRKLIEEEMNKACTQEE